MAATDVSIPRGWLANVVRGQLGKFLRRRYPSEYVRYFAPVQEDGPSGFHTLPRPFVLRVAHLEGVSLRKGDRFSLGLNLFETRESPVELFASALTQVAHELWGAGAPVSIEGTRPMRLSLAAGVKVTWVQVRFITPTELKGASQPEFAVLLARIRDRISMLRAHYGAGPLEIDFQAMGERARAIRMTRCELIHQSFERTSRATGQTHPLSGFTGVAEYEGDLSEFLPYLEAARWTGVGRQTVWGKGEIHCLVE
jgi:CRISPR-associated endoribonuclease Cas6